MKYLQLMFEKMRVDGYVYCEPGNEKKPFLWAESTPTEREWQLLEKCEAFVYTPEPSFDRTNDAKTAVMTWRQGFDHNEELDAPFPVFSVEYINGEPLDYFIMADGYRRETLAIIVIEINPKEYGYYALCSDTGPSRQKHKVFKSNTEGETVKALLQRLSKEKMGIETARQVVKIGNGKNKRTHRIRRIVHVSPKGSTHGYEASGIKVDWSHRWEVRGHWRKTEGLGKDRNGDYIIEGFTWVINYEKGPEHLPLVNKTRFVK